MRNSLIVIAFYEFVITALLTWRLIVAYGFYIKLSEQQTNQGILVNASAVLTEKGSYISQDKDDFDESENYVNAEKQNAALKHQSSQLPDLYQSENESRSTVNQKDKPDAFVLTTSQVSGFEEDQDDGDFDDNYKSSQS